MPITNDESNDSASPGAESQGLGPPGPNPLFFGILLGLALGLTAGLAVEPEDPAAALESEFVFRLVVGLAVAMISYWAAAALWLGWHRRLFQRFGVGSATAEAPAQQARDESIGAFVEETTEALDKLEQQVAKLEEKSR